MLMWILCLISTLDGSVAKGVSSCESHLPRSWRHIVFIFGEIEPFKKQCNNKRKEIEVKKKKGRANHFLNYTCHAQQAAVMENAFTNYQSVNEIFSKRKHLELDFQEGNTEHLPWSCGSWFWNQNHGFKNYIDSKLSCSSLTSSLPSVKSQKHPVCYSYHIYETVYVSVYI